MPPPLVNVGKYTRHGSYGYGLRTLVYRPESPDYVKPLWKVDVSVYFWHDHFPVPKEVMASSRKKNCPKNQLDPPIQKEGWETVYSMFLFELQTISFEISWFLGKLADEGCFSEN